MRQKGKQRAGLVADFERRMKEAAKLAIGAKKEPGSRPGRKTHYSLPLRSELLLDPFQPKSASKLKKPAGLGGSSTLSGKVAVGITGTPRQCRAHMALRLSDPPAVFHPPPSWRYERKFCPRPVYSREAQWPLPAPPRRLASYPVEAHRLKAWDDPQRHPH